MKTWMLAAILICGTSVFTSCSDKEDNPASPDAGIVEKMTGVWANEEIESGISPNTGKPYDMIVCTYIITPDGIGLYDELYMKDNALVDKGYDRHFDGRFSYHEVEDGLLCAFSLTDQGFLKYDNGRIIDLFEEDHPYVFTRCTPEQELLAHRHGLWGKWRKIYEESGKTPGQQLAYDKQIETYFFSPHGTGFFESLYFNGDLLVEKEYDRNDTGKFTYEWVTDTEIICTNAQDGDQWKVTYEHGVFTDLENADDPITYTKLPFGAE